MRTWVYSWPLLWSLLGFIVNIDSQNEYINDRNVLKLTKRDDELARRIARSHDMVVKGEPFLDSHYFVYHQNSPNHRRKREIIDTVNEHEAVEWFREEKPKKRVKRGYTEERVFGPQEEPRRIKRQAMPIPRLPFIDPLYQDQWYLVGRAVGGYDMAVRGPWLMGYAGRNVSISILDDGIQTNHPDLASNYDPLASIDINDHDNDPTPQDNGDNKHGTRCAGEVAAVAGNNVCGVGVAFKSLIGGVRMLDGPVSDSVEAAALSHNQNHIDIYSASWGPEDDGKTFDGPGGLAQEAFYRGIKSGRNGKGNIFVWASGNGGSRQDSCSADGYTTSIYTLSISSATFDNKRPWYLEECPSTIATTYSSANINQPAIVTVDVPHGCTKAHTGTSASAPLAAGIIALALEANPSLTWRDTQHIVLRTADPTPLLGNAGWTVNGVGRHISNKFGYGLMHADNLVKLARTWRTVPEQHMCTYEYRLERPNPRPVVGRFKMNFTIDVSGCQDGTPVLYLEHVQVVATIRYGKRGDLKLTLYSPSGTESVLLPPRPQDVNQNGFHKWPFLSVQTWGEDPRGTWTLVVESVTNVPSVSGMISDWSLLLYGTEIPAQPSDPQHSQTPVAGRFKPSNQANPSITSQTHEESAESQPSFGKLESVGNCHSECVGCSEPNSAVSCFACKHFTQSLRNRAGFKCVAHCDTGFYSDGDKCKKCSSNCNSCSAAETCDTCQGSLFLIETHTKRIDQGHCVNVCPIGLVPEYSHAVQARCMIKEDVCAVGYYLGLNAKCQLCDKACETCHGPGSLECTTCAKNYGNSSIGYCRPCCEGEDTPQSTQHQCEDCSVHIKNDSTSNFFSTALALFVVGGLVLTFYAYLQKRYCFGDGHILEYSPLTTNDEYKHLGHDDELETSFGSNFDQVPSSTV